MNLFTLFRDVNTKAHGLEYLQGRDILHHQRVCRKGHDMTSNLDGKNDHWACRKRCCLLRVSLRVGTWLEGNKVAFEKVVWLIYSWCHQYTSTKFCRNELLMSHSTSGEWKNRMREVCAKSLLRNPVVIGGEGMTVEMHESCFSSKIFRSKEAEQQWVFGGVCRETSECFLWAVAEPSTETLLAAVSGGVRPGSTIVSGLFESYGGSRLLPPHYTLLTTNKCQSMFVNPSTGDAEEVVWCASKRPKRDYSYVNRKGQVNRRRQDSYLCEYLWRKRHQNVNLVDQMYKDIASLYPLKAVVD